MTQAQFAQWLGVSIKQVKYLEHQRRNPSGPTRRLLDILAHQLSFDGMAAMQVLGAGAKELRLPAVATRPKPVAARKENHAVVPVAPPPPDALPPKEETPEPPKASGADGFVWD